MVVYGALGINEKIFALGVVGFMISIFTFLYDISRAPKSNKTKFEFFTELVRYMLFGTVAFPAAYGVCEKYTSSPELLVAGGLFASFFIVSLMDILIPKFKDLLDALAKKAKEMIENWRR
jgi:hypothetical protein